MRQQVARHPDTRGDWFAEVKACGVVRVAYALGLTGDTRMGLGPCPSCGAVKRHPRRGDKRGAVRVFRGAAGEPLWHCKECEQGGDAVTLAAWRVAGAELGRGDPRWAKVRDECAALGLCDPAPGSKVTRPKLAPLPKAPDLPERKPPPPAEVAALWAACKPVTDDPAVAAYLRSRRIEPATVAHLDNARALPTSYAWPSWWPGSRARAWRLVVQAFTPRGELASLHARAIVPLDNGVPKTLWPKGCAAGFLMADRWGAEFLRGTFKPDRVLVAEGLADMLSAADWCDREFRPYAVLAVTSGSEKLFAELDWPEGLPVVIATDPDAQGETYAKKIRAAIPARVPVSRMKFPARNTP